MNLSFRVNDKDVRLEVDPRRRLIDILREDLALTGTKEGCGQGECGSCTVFMNGKRINACLVPALQLNKTVIHTIEGVKKWPAYRAAEEIFKAEGAVQCGFCMPGMVISALALVQEIGPSADDEQIKSGIAGNMCRCTGYTKIISSIDALLRRKDILHDIKEHGLQ